MSVTLCLGAVATSMIYFMFFVSFISHFVSPFEISAQNKVDGHQKKKLGNQVKIEERQKKKAKQDIVS